MAETKKVYRVYIDQDAAKFTTESGDKVRRSLPELYLGDYFIFQADVRNADLTVFDFQSDAIFAASLNANLGAGDPDEAASLAADFNIAAQWADIDLSSGKICWQMNAASQAMIDYLGTANSKKVWLEVWFKIPGGEFSKILHEEVKIYNSGSEFSPVGVVSALPSRVATFADLPASPIDLQQCFVTTLGQLVSYDESEAEWLYTNGTTASAADE